MPFQIVRNDISRMEADAIVNTVDTQPMVGGGADGAIHAKAGPKLLEARRRIGIIPVGEARITPAFGLDAKYVIHTVGPVWQGGGMGEEEQLRQCYRASLDLARKRRCGSIAFPLISAGAFGFPRERALQIAIEVFRDALLKTEMQIFLVVFDRDTFRLSEQLFISVTSYISDHYADNALRQRRIAGSPPAARSPVLRSAPVCQEEAAPSRPMSTDAALADKLRRMDAGFSETLLRLIDRTGMKDSQIYKKANISRQHFSKIRKDPQYRPTKETVLAFAIALELDMEQTRDLLRRAGYALSNSSKLDVIVMYFIERRIYDLFQINATLFEFDQRLLGA